jgi:hypothetical protein
MEARSLWYVMAKLEEKFYTMMNGVPYSGICHGATTVLPAPSFVGKAGQRIKKTYFKFFICISVWGSAKRIIGEILGGLACVHNI